MPWMHITCKCGHTADIDQFTRAPISGELPAGVYQCPACRLAIRRTVGPSERMPWGGVIPGKVELVEVQAYL